MCWFHKTTKVAKGKRIKLRDSDSSRNSHSHSLDWQEHSVPPGFDPQGNVSAGSAQDMSTSFVHYDWLGSEEKTCFLTSKTQIIL
jgi:hypothetical protein